MIPNTSTYDNLDSRTELEQYITKDLEKALNKRGFEIHHLGSETSNAAGDRPDIIIFDESIQINVEVTKTTKSGSDREFLSIKDHLEKAKRDTRKKCFVIYCSPQTHYRMINAMRDYNILHHDDHDLKMLPMSFTIFEMLIKKLITSHKDLYKKKQLISLFAQYKQFVDDERVLEVLYNNLFTDDENLRKEIEIKEENKHQRTVEETIQALLNLEDDLRNEKGITQIDAIRNIIFLVFCKLYEEKREFEEDETNRIKIDTFKEYQKYQRQQTKKKAIHELFKNIKSDPDLVKAFVFTENDYLAEKLDDDFVIKFFIEPFEKYHFYTTRIDGIGAAYEFLGMRTGRDVKAGQFFTPENVVKFMVKLSELESNDKVLDPACGTARFLMHAMYDMIQKVSGKDKDDRVRKIRTQQLFGSDYDLTVAKLAKMNMYIHGDGKSNITSTDGLLLPDIDDSIDIILTNPPLGDQSYQKSDYDTNFKLKRMEVIPKHNLSVKKLEVYKTKLEQLKQQMVSNQLDMPKIRKNIEIYEGKIATLKAEISLGKIELEVTGNQMKGGALFIGISKHYLKFVRDENAPIEWRGGKLLIILDEGILNTEEYKNVREFIRKYFYIKAIISLSRDTFVPVSSTSTKTSILYAIKKEDPDSVQQEPIFFAHAEKVGIDTKRKVCENHLFGNESDILSKYFEFKSKILDSYVGSKFSKVVFEKHRLKEGRIND